MNSEQAQVVVSYLEELSKRVKRGPVGIGKTFRLLWWRYQARELGQQADELIEWMRTNNRLP